jgi:hypothetical protein
MPVETIYEGTENEYQRLVIGKTSEIVRMEGVEAWNESIDGNGYKLKKFRFKAVSTLIDGNLPLSSNPREPSESKAVKEMHATISSNEKFSHFHLYNNGMTIIAEKVDWNEKTQIAEITFANDKQGVCNGGHTYFAVKKAINRAIVVGDFDINAEIIELPKKLSDEEKLKKTIEIAQARNFSNPIKEQSLADAAGYFNSLKISLGKYQNLISWHENDSQAVDDFVDSKHFLRLLASLSPDLFKHDIFSPEKKNHKDAAVSDKSKVFKPWMQQNEEKTDVKISKLYPLAIDVLKLRDQISKVMHDGTFGNNSWKNHNNFKEWVTGKKRKALILEHTDDIYDLPVTFEAIIMGLLRNQIALVKDNMNKVTLVGWYNEPMSWCEGRLKDSLNEMAPGMSNTDSVDFKKQQTPYLPMMGTWDKIQKHLPQNKGAILYDIETNKKYELCKKGEGTHQINSTTGKFVTGSKQDYKLVV